MRWLKKLFGREKQDATSSDPSATDDQALNQSGIPRTTGVGHPAAGGAAAGGRAGGAKRDETPVPMHMFMEFREESSRRYGELRQNYQAVVKENDILKRAVVDVNHKLDAIMREQSRFRKDAEEGLRAVRQDVAEIKAKADPELQAQMVSAQSALSSLSNKPSTERRADAGARL